MQNYESLEDRMLRIKRQNAELLKRHMEVEADKKKAAQAKALVETHAKIDVKEMTPAERSATLESRVRVSEPRNKGAFIYSCPESGGRNLSSRLGINSASWKSHETNGSFNDREKIHRPKLESSARKALIRKLMESSDDDVFKNIEPLNITRRDDDDVFKNVKPLNGAVRREDDLYKNVELLNGTSRNHEVEFSDPFPSPEDLDITRMNLQRSEPLKSQRHLEFNNAESSNVFDNLTNSEPLNFHPDMDLTCPPPPIERGKIYGSGRLSKSRLNDTSNLPDLISEGAHSSDSYEQEDFQSLSYPSLELLAEALNNCHTEQYQNNQEDYPESYVHPSTDWPEIGNFHDFSTDQEKTEPERRKSALDLRMEAVRRERCQRFSRAKYMAQDRSSEVEITFVKNCPTFDEE